MNPAPVLFFGTPDFSVPCLQALLHHAGVDVRVVVTQPDRPAGRGQNLRESPIKQLAKSHSIPVLQPQNIRKDCTQFIDQLSPFAPFRIGFVSAFGQILPSEVLEYPELGCVNIHASLLPRWRGAAPIQRALLAGDRESGICLMQMEKGLDTGPVLASATIPIYDNDNAGSLHDKLAAMGGELVSQQLENLLGSKLPAISQDESGATYAQKIQPEECEIDWDKSPEEIERQVRALSPHPGAYTTLEGQRLKIFGVSSGSTHMASEAGQPGVVQEVLPNTLVVSCQNGSLEILDVQLEGRKRLSSTEFLKGLQISPGTILG